MTVCWRKRNGNVCSTRIASPHLQGDVPRDVDVVFIFIQPDLRHPERVTPHHLTQVWEVRLLVPLDVGDFRARYYLDASSTQPHLPKKHTKK